MNLRHRIIILSLALPWLGSAAAARAAGLIVEAGQTHTLHGDIVLNGDDVLEVRGTAEKPCVLVGNRHRIRTGGKWTGSLKITHCTIRDLGGLLRRTADNRVQGPGDPAFDVKVAGKGRIVIEHCTLDACSALHLQTDGASTASFRHNRVLENAAIAISKDIGNSGDCFTATGTSDIPHNSFGIFQ